MNPNLFHSLLQREDPDIVVWAIQNNPALLLLSVDYKIPIDTFHFMIRNGHVDIINWMAHQDPNLLIRSNAIGQISIHIAIASREPLTLRNNQIVYDLGEPKPFRLHILQLVIDLATKLLFAPLPTPSTYWESFKNMVTGALHSDIETRFIHTTADRDLSPLKLAIHHGRVEAILLLDQLGYTRWSGSPYDYFEIAVKANQPEVLEVLVRLYPHRFEECQSTLFSPTDDQYERMYHLLRILGCSLDFCQMMLNTKNYINWTNHQRWLDSPIDPTYAHAVRGRVYFAPSLTWRLLRTLDGI